MLHDAEACHFEPELQLLQRAAVTLKKQVQEEATRRVSKRLEYVVVVRHRQTIGDYMVTCQASAGDVSEERAGNFTRRSIRP